MLMGEVYIPCYHPSPSHIQALSARDLNQYFYLQQVFSEGHQPTRCSTEISKSMGRCLGEETKSKQRSLERLQGIC